MVEIRLRPVLQRYGIREHGAQAKIARRLGVERQAVARLTGNHGKQISLENIEGLCRWLLDVVEPSRRNELRKELPGCLFSMAGLWERMFRSDHVTTYLGEKVLALREQRDRIAAPARAWVSSMDVTAALKITQRLASEDSAARQRTELVSFHLEEDAALAEDRRRAIELFRASREAERTTSLIVGSQKVNMLSELTIAHHYAGFRAQPFQPPTARRTPLPFYVSYRDTDPPIPQSCFGGHDKPRGLRGPGLPGIYYRASPRKWSLAPWELKRTTAGLILVSHDFERDSLEVVLFGFCALGTRLLGDLFCENPDEFWPAPLAGSRDRFGVFVVPIEMSGDERPELKASTVIPLAA